MKDAIYWKEFKIIIYLNVNKVLIIHFENILRIYLEYI